MMEGIPGLPDLTHPAELMKFGEQVLKSSLTLAFLVAALGIAIALLSFSLRKHEVQQTIFIGEWVIRYSTLLKGLQHLALVLILVISGFFLTSTLGNRYHHWEQAKVAKVAESVAGDRLEQSAPQVRYTIAEPYTYDTQVNNKLVRVKDKREVNKYLAVAGSQIEVKLDQVADPQKDDRSIYKADFTADYQVKNNLDEGNQFFFEVSPPSGYNLLQNFKLEKDKQRIQPKNPGEYSFPFYLNPGEETRFHLTYQAQGGPRWVYNANSQLLSNFRLNVLANFPSVDFASGIIPTKSKVEGKVTQFTWIFDDNVSVLNPFGVFTSTGKIKNTGILPRLLLLAPAVFLWWILLLYLSLPMNLKNVAICGGIFFASLLALTYLSRVINPSLAWSAISLILLALSWGLGTSRQASLAAVICTISGAVLPILGLLVPYSGITLSLAGLLSASWLAARNWYGWFNLERDKIKEIG